MSCSLHPYPFLSRALAPRSHCTSPFPFLPPNVINRAHKSRAHTRATEDSQPAFFRFIHHYKSILLFEYLEQTRNDRLSHLATMSGMIRAFKNGDASFNNRRVRSLSGGSSNGSSSDSEEGKSDLNACVFCFLKAMLPTQDG